MILFTLDESFNNNQLYIISINHKVFNAFAHRKEGDQFKGSYNLFAARVMGLGYADYLRMCRDYYGAILTGKNEKYPIAHFKKDKAEKLIKILNQRISSIEKERK